MPRADELGEALTNMRREIEGIADRRARAAEEGVAIAYMPVLDHMAKAIELIAAMTTGVLPRTHPGDRP